MSEQENAEVWHETFCPNCGGPAGERYETGDPDVYEYECRNDNCRCEVFRADV